MNTNRYRTCARNIACFFVITALCSQVTPAHAQGSLTPPGAPGSTMHTLEEIYQRLSVLEANQAAIEGRLASFGIQQSSGDMVLIPAGEFVMGDSFNEAYSDERPVHTNYISAFYMDRYEVTSNQWAEVYTWATNQGYRFDNAGSAKGDTHPVHSVNWYDTIAWANAHSQYDGFTPCYTNANGSLYTNSTAAFGGGCNWSASGYRLPTEAEWEKAARGGASGRRFSWEDANTIQHARANYSASPASSDMDTSATTGTHPDYASGGPPYTSPAGAFLPNGYGLYDMIGNLEEWCWDWYSSTYYSSSPGTDPRGPATGSARIARGGYFNDIAFRCRIAYRNNYLPTDDRTWVGFRLVRSAP